MKIYPFLIACSLVIAPFTISDDAKAHRQFNKVKVKIDNELNVNYRALIKKYSKELKIDRTNKMALLTRAYAKGKINDYEGALKDINSLIKMDSNFNKEAIYFRAWFHTNLKNYSEAMNDYSRLIEKNEYLKISYGNRGFIKDILRDQEGACSDWDKGGELGNEKALSAFENHCQSV